jgi:hypothetical protein
VLEHIRQRRTNAEIAVRLGVSVNTVRTHVSSMLAKLEVSDREELARWRGEPGLASRAALRRRGATFMTAPLAWLREAWSKAAPSGKALATGGAVAVIAVAIVGMASVAARMSDEAPEPTPPAVVATPAATETSPPIYLDPYGSPTPTPKPSFVPSAEARTISGLFYDPRPSEPDEYRSVEPNPRDSFAPWNREDVVLYDIEAMTETNLGRGGYAGFSPDDKRLSWIARDIHAREDEGQEVWIMDLATGQRRSLGPGRFATWLDDDHLSVTLPGDTHELVTVSTGNGYQPSVLERRMSLGRSARRKASASRLS